MKHAVISGITADIGVALAERLIADGWRLTGLGRKLERLGDIDAELIDVSFDDSVQLASACSRIEPWDLFISCVGTMLPIGPFFSSDFDQWQNTIELNSLAQLRVLHLLWENRKPHPDVMFLAGGGTNNPMPNYSAYCVSKIFLIKMVELLADEEFEGNFFINGPGFTRTKIHEETLNAGENAGPGLKKTQEFLESDEGTSMDDIYQHMLWCMKHRSVATGRNFSTVHDPWRDGSLLADRLANNLDAFRLRRSSIEG
jgi:NADP-dependent 3-hydroxy acid dehydrogenase YdfG